MTLVFAVPLCVTNLSYVFTWIFSLPNLSIDSGHKLQASGCNWVVIAKGSLVDLCSLKDAETWIPSLHKHAIKCNKSKKHKKTLREWCWLHTLPLYSKARWGLKGKENGHIKQKHFLFVAPEWNILITAEKRSLLKMDDSELSGKIYIHCL